MTSFVQFADYVIRDFKASKVEREREGGREGEGEIRKEQSYEFYRSKEKIKGNENGIFKRLRERKY